MGIIIEREDENNVFFGWDESADTVIVGMDHLWRINRGFNYN